MARQPDLIIVGAGLSGLLTAWRCLDINPELSVTIIDAADKIAGNHTWSFNLSDVPDYLRDWIEPFIAYQWPQYEVRFPKRNRVLNIPYCTGNSESLRACVQPHIESGRLETLLSTPVKGVNEDTVVLATGDVLKASCVLDARGFASNDDVFIGYQKFVGRTIKTKKPHGLKMPIIMDATVEQLGGYRFVYCLPFSEDEVLVEDTYYTDGAELSENEVTSRIENYIAKQGWKVGHIVREEKGVLPITLAVEGVFPPMSIGIRGGFYHAVTGYSFPAALNMAYWVAWDIKTFSGEDYTPVHAGNWIGFNQAQHYQDERFFRLLNRMLFRAAKPEERYKVLQRFYGLSEGLIRRFYAGTLTRRDKIRILIGKPPVPISKALYNFSERAFIRRERAKKDGHNG